MKESLGILSGMVGHDQGGLRNLAEWGWSICNKGRTVPKSGDLALGTDFDTYMAQINNHMHTMGPSNVATSSNTISSHTKDILKPQPDSEQVRIPRLGTWNCRPLSMSQ